MRVAIEQAKLAAACDEVPVGAVLVDADNQMIAQGFNQPIRFSDPTAHAEINVLREAAKRIGNYRLPNTTLYVTVEPCVMCSGALMHARISRLVYGASEYKTGAIESACSLYRDVVFNHQISVTSQVLAEECAALLSTFFQNKRKKPTG